MNAVKLNWPTVVMTGLVIGAYAGFLITGKVLGWTDEFMLAVLMPGGPIGMLALAVMRQLWEVVPQLPPTRPGEERR